MFHKVTTKALPPGAPTRVVEGKTQAQIKVRGKLVWVPVNSAGRVLIQSAAWYAKINGVPTRLAEDRLAAEQVLASKRRHRERVQAGLEAPDEVVPPTPLSVALDDWNRDRSDQGRTGRYMASQRSRVERILHECGAATVQQIPNISREKLAQCVSMARGGKPATLACRLHNIVSVSTFFAWLKKYRHLDKTPLLPPRPAYRKTRAPVSKDEVRRLCFHSSQEYATLWRLGFATLARVGALASLRLRDVEFQTKLTDGVDVPNAGWISLQSATSKTKTGARVGVGLFALAELWSWCRHRQMNRANNDSLLFPSVNLKSVSQIFRASADKAGIPRQIGGAKITPHSLRHGGATLLLKSGVSPFIVMKLGGWKSMQMLIRHYGHVIPSDGDSDLVRIMD